MTVAGVPVTPMVSRKVCMFVMRMIPATAVPRIRAGRSRTTYAAKGAAMTPPIKRAPTMPHGMSAKLRATKKPMLGDGYQELAGVHGAHHLTGLHPSCREQRG